MRVLRNAYVDERERSGDSPLPFPQQMTQAVREGLLSFADDEHTDEQRSCLPAGQGVGGISEIIPAGDIVREVMRDAEAVLAHIDGYRS
jgi:enoyl-[acyl-carrier protein] reductase II